MKPVAFFHGAHPAANAALLLGARPVLVDSGFGSVPAAWLRGQGVAPERLALMVNTHHHSDHVGGNFLFHRLGVPIAAHAADAALVNARDPDACSAAWLRQPVPPYALAGPPYPQRRTMIEVPNAGMFTESPRNERVLRIYALFAVGIRGLPFCYTAQA